MLKLQHLVLEVEVSCSPSVGPPSAPQGFPLQRLRGSPSSASEQKAEKKEREIMPIIMATYLCWHTHTFLGCANRVSPGPYKVLCVCHVLSCVISLAFHWISLPDLAEVLANSGFQLVAIFRM